MERLRTLYMLQYKRLNHNLKEDRRKMVTQYDMEPQTLLQVKPANITGNFYLKDSLLHIWVLDQLLHSRVFDHWKWVSLSLSLPSFHDTFSFHFFLRRFILCLLHLTFISDTTKAKLKVYCGLVFSRFKFWTDLATQRDNAYIDGKFF